MAKSIFLKIEGATPRNRILDFLIVHREFDYSLKDIAKFSKVGYTTLKSMKKELVKNKWIVFTRKVGKAKMYRLNIPSTKVKKFIEFYWSVVDSIVESEDHPKKHSSITSAPIMAVSARSW
jgi:hypothetical protein